MRSEHHGALGAFRLDEDALTSEGHFHSTVTCRWKKLCYVRRAKVFYCLCIPANFFIIHASLKGCFHCPYTPESCFHSPCTRAQPHFAFPPLSLILVISFSAKANLPITFSIKYFSVSFQLLSENPRKNITFNSLPNVWGCPWGVQVHSQGEANQRA